MRILYAVQGTGNGHIARATEIIPILQRYAKTDVLVSGTQSDILPFNADFKLKGLSFVLGRKGGVSYVKTLKSVGIFRLLKDINELDITNYNLIISDFEPVSAWSCKIKGIKCVGLSHQNAVMHPLSPKPDKIDFFGEFVLKNYAPVTYSYGFHFKSLDNNMFTPVIRASIRETKVSVKEHFTVYLPAFSDKVVTKILSSFSGIKWEIFSKETKSAYQINDLHFYPISFQGFTQSFVSCKGILCSAGFETPSEAIYLGKKLCVVPMANQHEQQCNAAFLKAMGVPVINNFFESSDILNEWLSTNQSIQIQYPDKTIEILERIIQTHTC